MSVILGMMDLHLSQQIGIPVLAICGVLGLVGTALFVFWPEPKAQTVDQPAFRPGKGGDAVVLGRGLAKGGGGGALGGGDGGSAFVAGDGAAFGGEAGQSDRGGRGPIEANQAMANLQLPDGTWLFDYGRGGYPVNFAPEPDVPLHQAVAFAYHRRWGSHLAEAAEKNLDALLNVWGAVNASIVDGGIFLWEQGEEGTWTRVPHDGWAERMVSIMELMDWERSDLAALDHRGAGRERLVVASKKQFEARWPRYW